MFCAHASATIYTTQYSVGNLARS